VSPQIFEGLHLVQNKAETKSRFFVLRWYSSLFKLQVN
jgi:hypothetical protein